MRRKRKAPRPRAKDLFGQVPVTLDDLQTWVKVKAPHMASNAWRFQHYVKAWNVADKIRAAKIDGSFYEIEEPEPELLGLGSATRLAAAIR